jgi:hypothetical protein
MATVRICPAHSQVPPKILWWIAHSPAQPVSWLPRQGEPIADRPGQPGSAAHPRRTWLRAFPSEMVEYGY